MKSTFLLALVVFLLFLGGCGRSAEDYARNNTATAGWLKSNSGTPAMQIGGHWYSDDWGSAEIKQNGSRITGIIDRHPIGGALNGRTLYLAITDAGWTNRTAVLTLTAAGTLEGFSSEAVPYDPFLVEPMKLRRVIP